MNAIITYPLIFQAIVSIVLLFLWQNVKAQRMVSIIGSAIGLSISVVLFNQVWQKGTIAIQMGNWEAPFGITLVADTFAVTMVVLAHIVAMAVSLFSTKGIVASRVKFGYFPIMHLMIMGLSGAFLTGDIFNLYVWFEVIIISSFVLLTIGGKKAQIEGAVKYFTLNMLASIIFLTAIALLYGTTGTLNMAELATIIPEIEDRGLVKIIALIFFLAFGVKAGVFPMYVWLPAAYHTPPAAVSSLFGGLLTKLGVYAIIRVFTMVFPVGLFTYEWIGIVGVLTILSGALGAFVQKDIVKVFSYLIICHIGFMIAGFSIGTQLALTGVLFYMFHDIIVKSNLFLVSGVLHRITGSTKLASMGGIMENKTTLAILFAIPLFSLVGIPPLSGFWPKISLFGGAIVSQKWYVLAALIFGSFMTLLVVAKVWLAVFSKPLPVGSPKKLFKYFDDFNPSEKRILVIPILLLAIVSLYFGLFAEHIQQLSARIADELINNQTYIETVFRK
ncbi:MAG: Na+/H+ antiporter subunit D [Crocinitomicaceae bacterium]|nr:Na+/H+ antiporter subunit D [Crocinitomicaceae bacterium]